jgi:hypothetical protein
MTKQRKGGPGGGKLFRLGFYAPRQNLDIFTVKNGIYDCNITTFGAKMWGCRKRRNESVFLPDFGYFPAKIFKIWQVDSLFGLFSKDTLARKIAA